MTTQTEEGPAITELEKFEVERVDGVESPANGFPVLLMKGLGVPAAAPAGPGDGWREQAEQLLRLAAKAPDAKPEALWKAVVGGRIDEQPDIAGAQKVIQRIAQLVQAEAEELAAGRYGETSDIRLLLEAMSRMKVFLAGEQAASEQGAGAMPDTMMHSAAKSADEDFAYPGDVEKRTFTAAQRRAAAGKGHALPDGSYPIENAGDLANAARLAESGHGNVAAAKRLIARRAKELGVPNPLKSKPKKGKNVKAKKSLRKAVAALVAAGAGGVDNGGQTGELAKLVEAAVTKATAVSQGRVNALEAELAKVKAMPVQGGPVLSNVRPAQGVSDSADEWAAKAAGYRARADEISDPTLADGYRQLARQAEDKARQLTPA